MKPFDFYKKNLKKNGIFLKASGFKYKAGRKSAVFLNDVLTVKQPPNKYIKKIAIQAVLAAGKIILNNKNKVSGVRYKDARKSIITNVDLLAEKKIISIIQKNFPDHSIISEEKGKINRNQKYAWVIDPLDGTANYSQNIPFYCTSIAFFVNNKNILGVIYDPIHEEMFLAQKGKGSFLNNKKIIPSKIEKISDAICGFGFSNSQNAISIFLKIYKKCRKTKNLGSTSLSLCYVASGRLDAYIINKINNWDISAGAIIVEEAGGKISGIRGEKIIYEKKIDLIADNGLIHNQILKIIK